MPAAVAVAHFQKPQPAERVALLEREADHLGPALRKGLHLRRGRKTQYPRDLRRRRLLGVQHQRKPQLVLEEHHLTEILHRAHPRDRVLHSELLACQAAEHVHRIVARDGDEQIRFAHARLGQNRIVRAAAVEHHGVHAVRDLSEPARVVVHDGDVVAFLSQTPGDLLTHPARADENDLHSPLRS